MLVGSGWIGMEVAATARTLGNDVDHPRAGPDSAGDRARRRARPDVRVTCTRQTASCCGSRSSSTASSGSDGPGHRGRRSTAARPSPPTWCSSASARSRTSTSPRRPGWTSERGILIDESLRTSDPDIFAAGDVANAFHPVSARMRLRSEHWANALNGRAGRGEVDARPEGAVRRHPVLLHRPVRPRHGVLRLSARSRAGPGSSTAATSPSASSSRSGSQTARSSPA